MTSKPKSLTGSCLCGGVSYTVAEPLRPVVACHCTQCQKTSGHYVAATQAVAANLTLIKDECLTWFRSSETAERGFCRRCGGNLFWRKLGDEFVSIMAGTLDGPTGLKIENQIHTEMASDYYSPSHEIPTVQQGDYSFSSTRK